MCSPHILRICDICSVVPLGHFSNISFILISALLVPELVVLDIHHRFPPDFTVLLTACRPTWGDVSQTTYEVFKMVALYYLPFIIMGITYGQIINSLWSNTIPSETSKSWINIIVCIDTLSKGKRFQSVRLGKDWIVPTH